MVQNFEESIPTFVEEMAKLAMKDVVLTKNRDKFIKEEAPYFEHIEEFERAVDDYITEPADEDSTPLGEVPQEPTKGSISPGWIRGPYGMSIMHRT